MSLQLQAVDRVIDRLTVTYGQQFIRLYEGLDANAIKTTWAHELSEFGRSRESMMRIAWALENLPDRPPNVMAFRSLCRQAPAFEAPALPMPKADPERMRAELAKLGHLRKPAETSNAGYHKQWAHRILGRHAQGDKILPYTLKCAQDALRSHLQQEAA
ncbi:MAG TPA: hypothetical protein VMS38_19350 [Pseudorhodoferax sp.]|nr:hypothetical protein [Pseudorhodoferax sp.]